MKINSKIAVVRQELPALVLYKGFFYIAFEKVSEIIYKTICLSRMEIFESYRVNSILDGSVVKNPVIKIAKYDSLVEEKVPVYPCVGHNEKTDSTAILLNENEVIYFQFLGMNVFAFISYKEAEGEITRKQINETMAGFKIVKNPVLTIYGDVVSF